MGWLVWVRQYSPLGEGIDPWPDPMWLDSSWEEMGGGVCLSPITTFVVYCLAPYCGRLLEFSKELLRETGLEGTRVPSGLRAGWL
jgi:hypothetical protein